ncbi:hypothetical protein PQG02_25325 [Nostoc sp. UHCC 0926]|nr:hypothetical protein [Nostoc sp. UHCC 0926]WDD31965.1 hypothetical protein PQG02_25325 [Nostoc sp. UHCC 0926]
MPPQGILIVAAYLPKEWEVRFDAMRQSGNLGQCILSMITLLAIAAPP